MKAMILAAGRGERMRPLTDSTPKALVQVGGRALIEYHLAALAAANIREIVINVAWLGSQIKDYLGDGSRYGASISYSDEGDRALETGGGIAMALPLLGSEPFWVVNGDVHAQFNFNAAALGASTLAHLILVPNPEHNQSGDFALDGSMVRNEGSELHTFSGISLLRPELFADNLEGVFPLAPLLRTAADRDQVSGELLRGAWVDVGTPDRLDAVGQLYGKG